MVASDNLTPKRRRRRSNMPPTKCNNISANVIIATSLLIHLTSTIVCQSTASTPATTTGSSLRAFGVVPPSQHHKQYSNQILRSAPSATTNTNNNLPVNHDNVVDMPTIAHHSSPIGAKIRLHQQTDLDNVIESTTIYNTATSLLADIESQDSPLAAMLVRPPSVRQQQYQPTNCQLSPTWAGKWYQANKEPIRVTNTEISDKGLCLDQKGDKYLFESYQAPKQSQPQQPQQPQQTATRCLVCLVINERHLNVLQYKESSCQQVPTTALNRSNNSIQLDNEHSLLDSICSDITGDAQLESLFRLDTPAIECPISGQYSFTYDSCKEPQSALESCIDKKQLHFKFSACPDVAGSESKSEVLKCFADWSEGNNYYMIGRLEQTPNHHDKGKFRCFVYEKSQDGRYIQMAQSLEESCYGLISANEEGLKSFRLAVKPPTSHKCHFPSYIQSQSENWLSVDNSLAYMFNANSTKYQVKETREGNIIEEATCLQQFTYPHAAATGGTIHPHLHNQNPNQQARSYNNQQVASASRRFMPTTASNQPQVDQSMQPTSAARSSDVVYLVQITKNCFTTNYCVRFHRRTSGIIQIDYFATSRNDDNQCKSAFVGAQPQTQIITSTNLDYQKCPFEGAYTIDAPLESDLTYNPSNIFVCPRQSFLTAQCDHQSRLRIHSKCSPSKFSYKNLYCLGSWTSNGLVRLILADDDRQRYSAWYRDYRAILPTPSELLSTENPNQVGAKSQQLLATHASASSTANNANNQLVAPIVDLQIALITPLPIVAKPMQVRLTRRNQCSDLKGYHSGANNQGSFAGNSLSIQSPIIGYPSSAAPARLPRAACQLVWLLSVALVSLISLFSRQNRLVS